MRTMIDTIPALAWCFRADGTVSYLNQRWHEYTGISGEEAYGAGDVESTARVFRTILHPDDGPRVLAQWQHLVPPRKAFKEPPQHSDRARRRLRQRADRERGIGATRSSSDGGGKHAGGAAKAVCLGQCRP
jgi:PAS domain-containing protein